MTRQRTAVEARDTARAIFESGVVQFRKHAQQRMEEREMNTVDCENVVRRGTAGEAEWVNGRWRHHFSTPRMTVVIEFLSDDALLIVTCWRNR